MASKNRKAKRECARKKTYLSKDEAKKALKGHNPATRQGMHVYHCTHGSEPHWHLGHAKGYRKHKMRVERRMA